MNNNRFNKYIIAKHQQQLQQNQLEKFTIEDEIELTDTNPLNPKMCSSFFLPEETNNLMKTHNFVENPFLPEATLSRIPREMLNVSTILNNSGKDEDSLKNFSCCAKSNDPSNMILTMRDHIMKMSTLGTINLDAIFKSSSPSPKIKTILGSNYDSPITGSSSSKSNLNKEPVFKSPITKDKEGNPLKSNNKNLMFMTSDLYGLQTTDIFLANTGSTFTSPKSKPINEQKLYNNTSFDQEEEKSKTERTTSKITSNKIEFSKKNEINSLEQSNNPKDTMVPFVFSSGTNSTSNNTNSTGSLNYKTSSSVIHIDEPNLYNSCSSFPQVNLEGVRSSSNTISLSSTTDANSNISPQRKSIREELSNLMDSISGTKTYRQELLEDNSKIQCYSFGDYIDENPKQYEKKKEKKSEGDLIKLLEETDELLLQFNNEKSEPCTKNKTQDIGMLEDNYLNGSDDFLKYSDIAGPVHTAAEPCLNENNNYFVFADSYNENLLERKTYNVSNDFIAFEDNEEYGSNYSMYQQYQQREENKQKIITLVEKKKRGIKVEYIDNESSI